jgi:tRNA(His) guanylyltransferase
MSSLKLKDRVDTYVDSSNYRLLSRVPIIIGINGRSFHKVTSLLDKPYCIKFAESMLSTTVKLCMEVEGAIFAYQHNDEIIIVARNDQNQDTSPWYDNRLQKICSITSSIATQHFNMFASNMNLNLFGDALFTSQVFVVPNITEAINTIIYKQQHNFHTAIQFATFYELLKKYDKIAIKEMMSDLSIDEKTDLLKQECDIDFNEYHPSFRRGAACYKVPKIVDGVVKNKWTVNTDLPIFTKDQSFLSNIFKNGADIFRGDSL